MERIQLLTPNTWPEYELIDTGGYEKLERFGQYVLIRPEPQAVWNKSLPVADWERQAIATFRRDKAASGRNTGDRQPGEGGYWNQKPGLRDPWFVGFREESLDFRLKLSLSGSKHIGVFPEQAANWTYIFEKVNLLKAEGVERPKVLNLFAYTGGASLAACQAGADVTHVDAVKPVITWARDNMEASRLDHIRWIVEDATKFVQREERRGNRYHGLILDPPAYGRGPAGEKWVLEEDLNQLLQGCAELLDPENGFFLINLYSLGFSALILENLMRQNFGTPPHAEWGELYLDDQFRNRLPLGVFYRFSTL
jgi:23S rRNA (cytosine1962-C5)-methyltransferase